MKYDHFTETCTFWQTPLLRRDYNIAFPAAETPHYTVHVNTVNTKYLKPSKLAADLWNIHEPFIQNGQSVGQHVHIHALPGHEGAVQVPVAREKPLSHEPPRMTSPKSSWGYRRWPGTWTTPLPHESQWWGRWFFGCRCGDSSSPLERCPSFTPSFGWDHPGSFEFLVGVFSPNFLPPPDASPNSK